MSMISDLLKRQKRRCQRYLSLATSLLNLAKGLSITFTTVLPSGAFPVRWQSPTENCIGRPWPMLSVIFSNILLRGTRRRLSNSAGQRSRISILRISFFTRSVLFQRPKLRYVSSRPRNRLVMFRLVQTALRRLVFKMMPWGARKKRSLNSLLRIRFLHTKRSLQPARMIVSLS